MHLSANFSAGFDRILQTYAIDAFFAHLQPQIRPVKSLTKYLQAQNSVIFLKLNLFGNYMMLDSAAFLLKIFISHPIYSPFNLAENSFRRLCCLWEFWKKID